MAASGPVTKQYPVGLRYVRELCRKAEYRQCAQACRDLLQTPDVQAHPIHTAFLLFYTALAYDEMGRAMHHNSTSKSPALDTAETSYLAALSALPSPEDAELLCARLAQERRAESLSEQNQLSPSIDGYDVHDKLMLMSSPPRLRRESFSVRSPPRSPRTIASDLDDLESHDSFSELMTPNRVLKRDNSRMSLVEYTPSAKRHSRDMSSFQGFPAPARMQRDFSRMSLLETPPRKPMSQGLLRPIRPGSPPKQFYMPPRLANTSRIPTAAVAIPKLEGISDASPRNSVASCHNSLIEYTRSPDPVSPISRRGSERYSSSSDSTISAISPLTPTRTRSGSVSSDDFADESVCLRLQDHLDSMRMQLETHITLVQQVKEHLSELQAERASSRARPNTDLALEELPTIGDKSTRQNKQASYRQPSFNSEGLPRARSYWSFVPEDEKAAAKLKRIRDGRSRNWERKTERFDARKYQDLCERALNEL